MRSKRPGVVLLIMLIAASSAFSRVGQTSVTTLVMPYGAENMGMGEVGVSLADNVHSVFWNPASLPAVGDNLSVQFLYSTFYERMMPSYHIADLWHSDTICAAFLQDIWHGIDIGVAYGNSFVNMGRHTSYDELGRIAWENEEWEQVKSLSFGIRFAKIISVGVSAKQFDSHLAPGINTSDWRSGTAQGEVFDFGVRLEKKFTIADVLDVTPALGFSINNFPQDSTDYQVLSPYDSNFSRDPLPLERWHGASIKLNLLDLFGFSYAGETEYDVVGQNSTSHYGYKIQLSPVYALLRGRLYDFQGARDEHNMGYQWTFNYQQIVAAAARITALFSPAVSRGIESNLRAPFKLKPNLFFQYTTETIHSSSMLDPGEEGTRNGQKRFDRTFGISILGDIGTIPSLRGIFAGSTAAPQSAVAPQQPSPGSRPVEQDGELVP